MIWPNDVLVSVLSYGPQIFTSSMQVRRTMFGIIGCQVTIPNLVMKRWRLHKFDVACDPIVLSDWFVQTYDRGRGHKDMGTIRWLLQAAAAYRGQRRSYSCKWTGSLVMRPDLVVGRWEHVTFLTVSVILRVYYCLFWLVFLILAAWITASVSLK